MMLDGFLPPLIKSISPKRVSIETSHLKMTRREYFEDKWDDFKYQIWRKVGRHLGFINLPNIAALLFIAFYFELHLLFKGQENVMPDFNMANADRFSEPLDKMLYRMNMIWEQQEQMSKFANDEILTLRKQLEISVYALRKDFFEDMKRANNLSETSNLVMKADFSKIMVQLESNLTSKFQSIDLELSNISQVFNTTQEVILKDLVERNERLARLESLVSSTEGLTNNLNDVNLSDLEQSLLSRIEEVAISFNEINFSRLEQALLLRLEEITKAQEVTSPRLESLLSRFERIVDSFSDVDFPGLEQSLLLSFEEVVYNFNEINFPRLEKYLLSRFEKIAKSNDINFSRLESLVLRIEEAHKTDLSQLAESNEGFQQSLLSRFDELAKSQNDFAEFSKSNEERLSHIAQSLLRIESFLKKSNEERLSHIAQSLLRIESFLKKSNEERLSHIVQPLLRIESFLSKSDEERLSHIVQPLLRIESFLNKSDEERLSHIVQPLLRIESFLNKSNEERLSHIVQPLLRIESFLNKSNEERLSHILQPLLRFESFLNKSNDLNSRPAYHGVNLASRKLGAKNIADLSSDTFSFVSYTNRLYAYFYKQDLLDWPIMDRSAVNPGDAFCFDGNSGDYTVQLASKRNIKSVMYEHEYWPDVVPVSAPKDYQIWTCTKGCNSLQSYNLAANCLYSAQGGTAQICELKDHTENVHSIRMKVSSNYGQGYTCMYVLRVFAS